jgi:hypothetical protein
MQPVQGSTPQQVSALFSVVPWPAPGELHSTCRCSMEMLTSPNPICQMSLQSTGETMQFGAQSSRMQNVCGNESFSRSSCACMQKAYATGLTAATL